MVLDQFVRSLPARLDVAAMGIYQPTDTDIDGA